MVYYIDNELMIRNMEEADARIFTDEETKQGWHTDISKFLTRLKDQSEGICISLTAVYRGVPAGYVNIYITPSGGPFGGKGLPEIVDFGVLEKYRRRGIGSRLMDAAEQLAGQYADTVWLGVGLHSGYGSAQRMYVKRGYIPDGTGVWYRDKACAQYETEIANDDDLVLFLSRNLCRRPAGAELRMQHPGIEPAKISLCRPGSRYSGQVMDFRDELKQNGDEFDGCAGLEDCASFEEWIRFGDRLRVKYKEGYVPSEVFLAVRETDDRLVGIIDYRHPLTDFLMNFGGNIGYSIRPSERRKGYASEMLRLMLELCRFYGEKRVLLTCDSDNTASEKTILKNGGVLENEIEDTVGLSRCGRLRRYWISTGSDM